MNILTFRIHTSEWELAIVGPDDLDGNLGVTYYTDYKILLAHCKSLNNMRHHLIHELTHAYRWSYGMILSDQDKVKLTAQEIEEIIANNIEFYAEDILKLTDELWCEIEEELKDLEVVEEENNE